VLLTIPPLPPPTTAEVAALLHARTKDLTGNEVGDFTANTRPTDTQVVALISMAYNEVTGQTGILLGDPCASAARALITIRAAMWVEASFFPEQVRSDRSVYQELADEFTAGLPRVIACVEGNVPSAGGTEGAGTYRFGVLDVHGWTASPYYGAPAVPPPDPLA
jgi:hypothetical protein